MSDDPLPSSQPIVAEADLLTGQNKQWVGISKSMIQNGEFDSARTLIDRMYRETPPGRIREFGRIHVQESHLLYAQGDSERSLACLYQAINCDPANVTARSTLITLAFMNERPQEADRLIHEVTPEVVATIKRRNWDILSFEIMYARHNRLKGMTKEIEGDIKYKEFYRTAKEVVQSARDYHGEHAILRHEQGACHVIFEEYDLAATSFEGSGHKMQKLRGALASIRVDRNQGLKEFVHAGL